MITAARLLVVLSIFTTFAAASLFTPTPTTRSHKELEPSWIFSKSNGYGAPIPPWAEGAKPGWSHCPQDFDKCSPNIPCLQYGTPLCNILSYFPNTLHCPRPSSFARYMGKKKNSDHRPHHARENGPQFVKRTSKPSPLPNPNPYEATFSNYNGAIHADDYMTYGLVDSVEACQVMCDSVQGCHFANSYYDVTGKDGSPLLTCALYTSCHGVDQATNFGGQTQSNGMLNHIEESYGWCQTI